MEGKMEGKVEGKVEEKVEGKVEGREGEGENIILSLLGTVYLPNEVEERPASWKILSSSSTVSSLHIAS
jgi:hypothetical protein